MAAEVGTTAQMETWQDWMNRLLEDEGNRKRWEHSMAVYKRGKIWWYKFNWNGENVRESTKQTNKRVAEQMEATHRTSLAKGEVGIRDRKPAPTVAEFPKNDFMPHVRAHFADKPATLAYYQIQVKHLTGYGPWRVRRLTPSHQR